MFSILKFLQTLAVMVSDLFSKVAGRLQDHKGSNLAKNPLCPATSFNNDDQCGATIQHDSVSHIGYNKL